MKKSLALVAVVLLWSTSALAQTIPGNFPWNPGMTSKGGVPVRTTICATLPPGNGTADDSARIQAALDSCGPEQVVQLAAGNFVVNNYVLIHSNVSLRGAGGGQTILTKTNGARPRSATVVAGTNGILTPVDPGSYSHDAQPIIIVGPGRWNVGSDDAASQNLTVDGAQGGNSVTLANASAFHAGDFVLLDERSGASWQPVPTGFGCTNNLTPTPCPPNVWKGDVAAFNMHWAEQQFQDDNGNSNAQGPYDDTPGVLPAAMSWFSRQDRPTSEIKEILSISGNTVTFTSPLSISYRTSHQAQVTPYTTDPSNNGHNPNGIDVHIKGGGVENLTVVGGADGAIRFETAAYSWAKAIECTQWIGECVAIDNSFRVELRDSYLHTGSWPTPGGAGYAISLANGSAEALIENNISIDTNKVMVFRSSGAGSVVSYNYADDGWISYDPTWIEAGINASHMVGSHHALFEGNYSFNIDSDYTHGNASFLTFFRNQLTGVRRSFNDLASGHGPIRAVGLAYGSWNDALIGNVLGVSGATGWAYTDSAMSCNANGDSCTGNNSNWNSTPGEIYMLGYDPERWGMFPDPQVLSTVVRDGNFDYVTNSQRWHTTPGGYTIPNSLYLAAAPAFFGTNPWPWVTPEGATKTFTLPAKARFDAGMPYTDGGGNPPPVVNGACGPANGVPVSSPPTADLCSAGTPSAVTGSGPWSWTCTGSGTGHTNASCSAPLAQAGDTTPPSVPTGLTATGVSQTEIDLTWTASTDNVGVTGYDVYRNGVRIGSPPGTSFADTGRTPGTTYTYTVDAFDAAGNISAQSGAVNGTTQSSQVTIIIGDQDTSPTWIDNSGAHHLIAQLTTLPQNATLKELWIYFSNVAGTVQIGIYDALGTNGHPKNLKKATPSFTPVVGWNKLTVSGPALPAANYWLTFLPTDIWLSYPTDFNNGLCVWKTNVAGNMPNTFPSSLSGSRVCQRPFYAVLSVP